MKSSACLYVLKVFACLPLCSTTYCLLPRGTAAHTPSLLTQPKGLVGLGLSKEGLGMNGFKNFKIQQLHK